VRGAGAGPVSRGSSRDSVYEVVGPRRTAFGWTDTWRLEEARASISRSAREILARECSARSTGGHAESYARIGHPRTGDVGLSPFSRLGRTVVIIVDRCRPRAAVREGCRWRFARIPRNPPQALDPGAEDRQHLKQILALRKRTSRRGRRHPVDLPAGYRERLQVFSSSAGLSPLRSPGIWSVTRAVIEIAARKA